MTNDFECADAVLLAEALYEALLEVQETYAGWHPGRHAADAALARYREAHRV